MKLKLLLLCLLPLQIFSQVQIPGDLHDPIDKFEDSISSTLYSSILPITDTKLKFNDIYIKSSWNSKYARGYNDGAVWKGKGLTNEIHGGFSGRIGALTYVFNPVVFYSDNETFPIPNLQSNTNRHAYPYSDRIDWVQRFGNGSFVQPHLGQSELRYNYGKLIAAIGTQNYSLGPAVYNPIIMSRQAGGFPHLRIGLKPTFLTSKKKIARIEANFMLGHLTESEYFDTINKNNDRYLNGLFVAITPSILPNLTIGINRVLYKQNRYFRPVDLLSTIYIADDGIIDGDTLSRNDAFDQLASFTVEWKFREIGFRAYLEYAKNDFTSDGAGIRQTAVEPEHSRGYTLGFEKRIKHKSGAEFHLTYEHTNLSIGRIPWRFTPSFYAHSVNRQGYTHEGQIIGAGIGPGGNSDHLGLRMQMENMSHFILIQRIERDRDYFVKQIRHFILHDIEYSVSLASQRKFKDKYVLFAETTLSHNYNRNYLFRNDRTNISFGIGGRILL